MYLSSFYFVFVSGLVSFIDGGKVENVDYSLADNMNGDIYYISNPNQTSNHTFSTVFSQIHNGNVEYFDVYSPPITSKYGEVFWTLMDEVNLPSNIVSRFTDKKMSIVGYETDQVFEDGTSVPITWSYNHHYEAYLYGEKTRFEKIKGYLNKEDYGQNNHGFSSFYYLFNEQLSQFFSEGNGGESRGSFHGYPRNYAQVLYSPKYFRIQPMQIDTRNRDPKYINDTKFHPFILPKESAAPPNAVYSGLLECPCTTRIHKKIVKNYYTESNAYCHSYITNSSECLEEGRTIKNVSNITMLNNISIPRGCFFDNNGLYFNSNNNSKERCNANNKLFFGNIAVSSQGLNFNISLNYSSNKVQMNFTGPANKWYGIAFNATSMGDLPYSIIILCNGTVQEWKLANHDMGNQLPSSVVLKNEIVSNNVRNIILERNISIHDADYFSFSDGDGKPLTGNLPLLTAIGQSEQFGYHHYRTALTMNLNSVNGYTCICYDGIKGSINGIPFISRCAPEPTADLLKEHNPTCYVDTYPGGLKCCAHKNVLLDANQEQPQDEMTYRVKFRFYFQDYLNHQYLTRFYFQTEAFSGEYVVPKCQEGIPPEDCIHTITARFQLSDMVSHNDMKKGSGIKFIYAAPHCHAPACISVELYNADTGDLICRVVPELGKGRQHMKYDEEGYIRIDPCVWGEDDGLLEPPFITWDTNLTSIKRNNNTYEHYGEMASWQNRGIIV